MCGIAGIINFSAKPASKDLLARMIREINHRGPDDQGFFVDRNVGLAHCRLSILDLSAQGHQPMASSDKNLWIVFNGEIYNYIELKEELSQKGYRFATNSDTEVILAAYREWGKGCLDRFNGMWAFVIYDAKEKKIFCARDRFGIKPFYYYSGPEFFAFASEIKALLTLPGIGRSPQDGQIYNYLVFGIENYGQETFFKDIFQLGGGHSLTIDLSGGGKKIEIEKWYKFFDGNIVAETEDDQNRRFLELLQDSVRIRLRSDVPVGSCLSGGLDSSTVVCLASKILKGFGAPRQEVFTSSFPGTAIDEAGYARQVIDATGCAGNFVYPDFSKLEKYLDDIVWHQEEPFGGPGALAQWLVMKAAHDKNVKVLLDGQGADETLLGYERYYVYFFKELARRGKIGQLAREFFLAPAHSRLSYKDIVKYSFYFGLPWVRKMSAVRKANPFLQKDFAGFGAGSRDFMTSKDIVSLQKKEISNYQLPHLLRYEDKNSMAFSIETRLPFLDYRLVEFALNLPSGDKIKNGWTKFILRDSTKGIVPDAIRWRKYKIGFEVTEREWLKKLEQKIIDKFSGNDFVSKRYLDGSAIAKSVLRGGMPLPTLWRVYNLELWAERFGVGM